MVYLTFYTVFFTFKENFSLLIKKGVMKNTIRIERAILNITQAGLAEQVGVSRQTINAIESQKYVPSAVLALKIARVFQKKVDDIFTLEEND